MRLGNIQRKLLILLASGVALGCSTSPKQSFRILTLAKKEWQHIHKENLKRSIRQLYLHKLITEQKNPDDSVSLFLTEKGKQEATLQGLRSLKIKRQKHWDKLWRITLFDIPEKHKKFRDIFRSHLKTIGFYELQRSVFIFPFPCEKEILAIIKLYNAEAYVRFITAKKIDNESLLKNKFSL